jgi:hypothetical protein
MTKSTLPVSFNRTKTSSPTLNLIRKSARVLIKEITWDERTQIVKTHIAELKERLDSYFNISVNTEQLMHLLRCAIEFDVGDEGWQDHSTLTWVLNRLRECGAFEVVGGKPPVPINLLTTLHVFPIHYSTTDEQYARLRNEGKSKDNTARSKISGSNLKTLNPIDKVAKRLFND